MEYVPSYAARCFQPEVCFYGVIFSSGGSEQCPGETFQERTGLKAPLVSEIRCPQRLTWVDDGCFRVWRVSKTGRGLWTSPWPLVIPSLWISRSLTLPKHEGCCQALGVPWLIQMWHSAENMGTFPLCVPRYLGVRNGTFPQTGKKWKMFSSVTQIPERNVPLRARVRENSDLSS